MKTDERGCTEHDWHLILLAWLLILCLLLRPNGVPQSLQLLVEDTNGTKSSRIGLLWFISGQKM